MTMRCRCNGKPLIADGKYSCSQRRSEKAGNPVYKTKLKLIKGNKTKNHEKQHEPQRHRGTEVGISLRCPNLSVPLCLRGKKRGKLRRVSGWVRVGPTIENSKKAERPICQCIRLEHPTPRVASLPRSQPNLGLARLGIRTGQARRLPYFGKCKNNSLFHPPQSSYRRDTH
jgi:hypothetical protein